MTEKLDQPIQTRNSVFRSAKEGELAEAEAAALIC